MLKTLISYHSQQQKCHAVAILERLWFDGVGVGVGAGAGAGAGVGVGVGVGRETTKLKSSR